MFEHGERVLDLKSFHCRWVK